MSTRRRSTRVTTLLNDEETKDFARVKKFVESYCGKKVSRAEVIRYLVRNWTTQ